MEHEDSGKDQLVNNEKVHLMETCGRSREKFPFDKSDL